MGMHHAEVRLVVAARPEHVYETILDYETFPEWQNAVQAIEVLERDSDGRGSLVRVSADAKFREVTYVLRYHYEAPSATTEGQPGAGSAPQRPWRIWWDFVEGDFVKDIEGEFLFEPTAGGTLATYRLGIDPGVPVPGIVARKLNGTVMKRSVEDLRDEAERRISRPAPR